MGFMINYDQQAREDYKASPSSIYYWVLASSAIYYLNAEMTPLLSDECFDKMCLHLLNNYDSIPKHSMLHHLVTKDNLQSGSFYNLLDIHYPMWLVRIAQDMSNKLGG